MTNTLIRWVAWGVVLVVILLNACLATGSHGSPSSTRSLGLAHKRAAGKTAHHNKPRRKHSLQQQPVPGGPNSATQKQFISGQSLIEKGPPPKEMSMKKPANAPEQTKVEQHVAAGKPTMFNGTTTGENAKPEASSRLAGAPTKQCESISVRRPWSKATPAQRKACIKAATCLASVPGETTRKGYKAESVWQDFILLHWQITFAVHGTAFFLPCHRLFLNAWFYAIQKKCNYTGDMLFFDLPTYGDANTVYTTPDLWSDDYLGPVSGDVTSGMLKDMKTHFFVDDQTNAMNLVSRPIQRKLRTNSMKGIPFVNYMTSDYLRAMLAIPDYDTFRQQLEDSTHSYLHVSVAGDLVPTSSPNDFFFYCIHSFVDLIWTAWQEQDGKANQGKFGGQRTQDDGSSQAQLTDVCPMLNTWSIDFNVADMLDVSTKPNCYRYDFPESLNLQGL